MQFEVARSALKKLEQRHEGGKGQALEQTEGKAFLAEGTASTKAPRWDVLDLWKVRRATRSGCPGGGGTE